MPTGDPVLDAVLAGKGAAASSGDPVLDAILAPKKKASSGNDVEDRLAKAEALLAASGVTPPEDIDGTGLARRVVDVISRPNYAVAGAVEEAISGGDPISRIGRELFSGVGGIKGEKRGFAQVMERQGVGEMGSISRVAPFLFSKTGEGLALQQGGVFDVTGRGFAGFVGDVALDPLTYLTPGASGLKVVTKTGTKVLGKKGVPVWNAIQDEGQAALKNLVSDSTDDVARLKATTQVSEWMRSKLDDAVKADPELLAKGGLHWAGFNVVKSETFRELNNTAKRAVLSLPGGEQGLAVAEKFRSTVAGAVDRTFGAFGGLRDLPAGVDRNAVRDLARDYTSNVAAHSSALRQRWAELDVDFKKLAKGYGKGDEGAQALGKKFADLRQGTGTPKLTQAEGDLFKRWAATYDELEAILVREGVISAEQAASHAGTYLHQIWKNTDALDAYHVESGFQAPKSAYEKFTRSREFKNYAEGVAKSKERNYLDRATAGNQPGSLIYPELIPDYDVMRGLGSYMDQMVHSVWEKNFAEEAAARFGIAVPDYNPAANYVLRNSVTLPANDIGIISKILGESRSLRSAADIREWTPITAKTVELTRAQKKLDEAFKNVPIKHVEESPYLKHADEVSYYRRRGYDVVEEAPGKMRAYRLHEITANDQSRWAVSIRRAKEELAGAEKRARRLERKTNAAGESVEGWEELHRELKDALPKLSPVGRKALAAELVAKAHSEGQVLRVLDAVGLENMPQRVSRELAEPQPGWVPREGGLWGDKRVSVPQAVVDMIENPVGDLARYQGRHPVGLWLNKMVKAWDTVGNTFKAINYPFYPSGAVRDTYNNVMNNFLYLGAGAFARPLDAFHVMRGTAGKTITLAGRQYEAKTLKQMFTDAGIMDPSGSSFAQITGEEGWKQTSKLGKARAARAKVDNWTRAQLALNDMSRGADLQTARNTVAEFLFDYRELSAFDRDVMRRLIPFYVFPRKAIELYGRQIATQPGRVANLVKPFSGREDENQAMTQWEGEGFKFRLERDGRTITMLNGIDIPIRTLDSLWRGGAQKTLTGTLAMMGPQVKVPYMMTAQKDPFTNREFGRASRPFMGAHVLEHAPKAIQVWAGYKKELDAAGRPRYTVREDRVTPLLEATMTSRIFSTGDRQFREYIRDDPNFAAAALDFLTGLRFKSLNLDEQMERRRKQRLEWVEQEAARMGAMKTFQRTYEPKR